jgi:hypothetical protein
MSNDTDWFRTDKEGLARLLERKGKAHAVLELIQNAWDEPGVTRVEVRLDEHGKRGRSTLVVDDDAPNGFTDLSDAYTLFAPSNKVTDATKRGRFNLGEKLLLSICDSAEVRSTTGGWRFTETEGRKRIRTKRDYGSRIEAVIRLTAKERQEVAGLVKTLLPPVGIVTTFNGVALDTRKPVRTFTATLPTEIGDYDGILRRTRRATTVRLFEPLADEQAHIYEMGIPVVEHEGRWHVDVGQKVPVTLQRDNVTPAYLREIRVAILNAVHDLITKSDAASVWVKDATSDDRVSGEAFTTMVTKRYGEKVVVADPSDPGASMEAMGKGYQVITGGMFSGDQWRQFKRHEVAKPAGQVTPSRDSIETSPDGVPPIPEDEWTDGMRVVADYAQRLALDLLGTPVNVWVERVNQGYQAAYSPGLLRLNLRHLGHRFFDRPDQHAVDSLLLHEYAHHVAKVHLSEQFHDEVCRLGALLRDSSVRL